MIIIYIVNIKYINYIDKKLINILIYIIFNRFGGCLSEIIEINYKTNFITNFFR